MTEPPEHDPQSPPPSQPDDQADSFDALPEPDAPDALPEPQTPAAHRTLAPPAPPDDYYVNHPDHPLARHEHQQGLWAYIALAALGGWLVASPATLGYAWSASAFSEVFAGGAILVLAILALNHRRYWAPWVVAGLGVWLLFAPLALWTEHPASYLNHTFVGIVVIALAIVIPRRAWAQPQQPTIPPGWSFNPSSWVQRTPIILLAWLCFIISRYLTGYQLDYTDTSWDPLFGQGTQRVLDSDVAEAWPISDAGLGALAYALEALIGAMAGPSRWRTAPWVVALFGILVVPAGIVSIVLIILQPVAVGHWCTLCLVAAVAMLIMACLTLPEVVAMLGYLQHTRKTGQPTWEVFWRGGPHPDAHEETEPTPINAQPITVLRGMIQGVSFPYTLIASLVLGIWIMVSPPLFNIANPAANSHFLTGWLIITITVLAFAEVFRTARLINIPLGAWIIATPWLFTGVTDTAQWNAVVVGSLLILLSIVRGRLKEQHGAWQRWII